MMFLSSTVPSCTTNRIQEEVHTWTWAHVCSSSIPWYREIGHRRTQPAAAQKRGTWNHWRWPCSAPVHWNSLQFQANARRGELPATGAEAIFRPAIKGWSATLIYTSKTEWALKVVNTGNCGAVLRGNTHPNQNSALLSLSLSHPASTRNRCTSSTVSMNMQSSTSWYAWCCFIGRRR